MKGIQSAYSKFLRRYTVLYIYIYNNKSQVFVWDKSKSLKVLNLVKKYFGRIVEEDFGICDLFLSEMLDFYLSNQILKEGEHHQSFYIYAHASFSSTHFPKDIPLKIIPNTSTKSYFKRLEVNNSNESAGWITMEARTKSVKS